jgi:hypothetical protein
VWHWLRHPRLSLYLYRRKHHHIAEDPRKERRADKYDLHPVHPHVHEFLLSQQSLVVSSENVWIT